MTETHMIGIDLAKSVFQLHGAAADGTTLFRRRLSRAQLERFMAAQPPCVVAMEACASAHHWARRVTALGHEVRLIAPIYVKPFVKRHKTDAADAEAIVEAAMRPNMRFVAPKSVEAQARAMLFRAREQLIKQRTETVNALRGHLAEFGLVAPAGIGHVPRLAALVEDEGNELPALAREMARLHLERIERLSAEVDRLTERIAAEGAASPAARLLRTMPGVGSIAAMAVETFVPDLRSFARGPRLRRLARAHAARALKRREAAARPDLQDGPARCPEASDHRRHEPHRQRAAPPRTHGALAPGQARAQAPHGRGHRAGQQDGPPDLGHADEGRGLQGAGGHDGRGVGASHKHRVCPPLRAGP